ncbi:hypothetical protein GRX03_11155 [Halovenus sp. WSH3]|uniref:Uncharacterized protein n=1 Tax=Halovenus carboxidivorans TaxID=2692199 RepID=A0A6B0T2F8_9EURY|nr:hypothetical protein [Halovenus carboxidivorans]MXR52155.1 hypothetical protein [Halovenus carboxidivorans]
MSPSRRDVLALSASGVAVSLSGCLDAVADYLGADAEGEFVVALANIRRPSGVDDGPGTPEDIVVRIDLENRRPERLAGRIEMELRYAPDGESAQTWTKTDSIEARGGTSPRAQYVFESAYQPGSAVPGDYEFDAEIVDVRPVDAR